MAKIIDGKAASLEIVAKIKSATAELLVSSGVKPGIAVVIVGADPASQIYVAAKGKKATECGFSSVQHTLPDDTSEARLIALLGELNADPGIHGILVQLPLPPHISQARIIQAISPQKDVDGFNFVNVGRLGFGELEAGFVPCTPAGSMLLIEAVNGRDLSGLNAVVVGRSNIVGKPMANLLLNANATVTVAHSRTNNLADLCRGAHILVAAVGKPGMIKAEWIMPGATVIDVGINRVAGGEGQFGLMGDVAYEEARAHAGAITPVPGGVGPMTIALLMANTFLAACRAAGRSGVGLATMRSLRPYP